MKPLHIEICDVTLRDGEQTPGVSFTCEEKVRIAEVLDRIGVEVIEAGFPATSSYEKRCVSSVAAAGLDARICCLARARKADVDAAIDANVDIVSIFIPTSELHVRHKFHVPREKVLAEALEMVDYTHDHGLQVRFAAEDASRTDLPFLLDAYRQAEEHNADLLSFADTVGAMTPLEMYRTMGKIVKSVKNHSAPIATTTWGWPRRTRSPLQRPGLSSSTRRSTASGSGRGTQRSRRSWSPCT